MKKGKKKKSTMLRKTAGAFLVVLGVIAIVTPFTPWGFATIVGLEMMDLGIAKVIRERMTREKKQLKEHIKHSIPK